MPVHVKGTAERQTRKRVTGIDRSDQGRGSATGVDASREPAGPSDRLPGRSFSPRPTLRLARSESLHWLVRVGFLARAITYGVIAGLTAALALGIEVRPASANPQGALAVICGAPLGRLMLAIISVALLAYAIWKLGQTVRGRGPEGGGGPGVRKRLASLGGGLIYLAFFAVSIAVLTGNTGNGSRQPRETASQLIGVPGGEVLLAVAGIGLLAVSIYQAYDAIRGDFANDNKIEQMSRARCRAFLVIGRVGLLARAVVFSLVGYFLLRAAIELHAGTAVGVDGALASVQREPLGSWLLTLVAVGLLTFAAFSVLEARYRRL
jgi:hypothetical protein